MNIQATVEIDDNRGVVWVHSPKGYTFLRICGLAPDLANRVKAALEDPAGAIDVTVTGFVSS